MCINFNMINQTSSVNFTGRCPAIRKGQWASHVVNSFLPHESVTRYQPLINHIEVVKKYEHPCEHNFQLYPKKVLDIINKRRILNDKIFEAREDFVSIPAYGSYRYATSAIEQLQATRLGNCHENAKAAESILRANGVNNPAVAHLYIGGHNVDHVVCVFNRDGSKVKTIENNNTIIVDPWVGIVDFANNAIAKYKTMLDKYVAKGQSGKATLQRITEHPMTQADIKQFKTRFPEFIQKRPD